MDYGMISKIEKAKTYATEKNRIQFDSFTVNVNGDNSSHDVSFNGGTWRCDCDYFSTRGYCSHTMAMERVLDQMLPRTTPS